MDKIKNQLQISVSNGGFVDEGDGVVSFPGGLTITDDSVMRSGAKYDIASLDISKYSGQLTADHEDSLETLIGKTINIAKEGNRVLISGIKYAVKENPYARLAYDLLIGGFSNSFSIETIGSYPDAQDYVYRDHELVGLSQVVVPNNYNAKVNQFNELVRNSLASSQKDGLDVAEIEKRVLNIETPISSEEVADSEDTNDTLDNKDEDIKDDTSTIIEDTDNKEPELDNIDDSQKETEEVKKETEVDTNINEVEETENNEVETEEKTNDDIEKIDSEEETKNNKNEEKIEMTAEQIAEIIANAIKPLAEELASTKELAKNALDAQAKEPEFKEKEEVKNTYDNLSADELFAKQLNAAVAVERTRSVDASKTLHEINERNLNALKEAKIVNAALTLTDLGNFVIAPELYNQIATVRTDYSAIINATTWKETQSIEFGWLTRSSDIDMQNVALGITGDNGSRLKPVTSIGYGAHSEKLEELAAVVPISINVIKFAAADILSDAAEGYRNDFDKKRAQLIIARLQQAVDATGNKQTFDISDGLLGWASVVAKISDATTVGTLIFNNKTLAALKGQAIATLNAAVLTELASGSILGTPYILVPNDLLPTINSTETKTFKVHGLDVTIDQAVFYGDLRTFTGRTSGGLKYDVDGSASYEIDGTVYSAYQRNEVVLRGSFFRGGVVKDTSVIASIPAIAVS